MQIGQAKVATSAEEARQFKILGPQDRIVMHRDHLLSEAKKEVLHMANTGYKPPAPELIYAAGRDSLAAIQIGAWSFKEGKYITEYEGVIAGKLAHVMTGGDLSRPAWVSEQYFLDLEREAFLSLCGEQKTQERMWALLEYRQTPAELGGDDMTIRDAVIVSAARTPVGKAKRGSLATVRPDELGV